MYYKEKYPDLFFVRDGAVFELNGKQSVVIDGAYSIHKAMRLMHSYGWWSDEQPSQEIKRDVEYKLNELGWKVDMVLSHTTPLIYEPVEVFLPGVDQSDVNMSAEVWLDGIRNRLKYEKYYCGHYYAKKKIDRVGIIFENFNEFCGK